jgi:hypothetical protein
VLVTFVAYMRWKVKPIAPRKKEDSHSRPSLLA